MIVGTADPRTLAARAPNIERFDSEALDLGHVEMLQLVCEIAASEVEAHYPPALHPTLPPLAVWQCRFRRVTCSPRRPCIWRTRRTGSDCYRSSPSLICNVPSGSRRVW